MLFVIRNFLRRLLEDSFAWNWLQKLKDYYQNKSWESAGRPVPPPHGIKQRIVASYASLVPMTTLIETGTLFGDMVYAMRNTFARIISIELNENLARRAQTRFKAMAHVEVLHGDSARLLPNVLRTLSGSCIFWLDGHYSGGITSKGDIETPVMQEVKTILEHKSSGHIILIDDARSFDGSHDYPTIFGLRDFVKQTNPDCEFVVSHDVIRIFPRSLMSDAVISV